MAPALAYFLTWTTYGTWLRGDERGWAERVGRKTRYASPDPSRVAADRGRLKHDPIVLTPEMRLVVDRAIRDGCAHRGWRLHALNARTNHVHAVVAASTSIDRALVDLKAWGTRRLRERGMVGAETRVWTRHGSTRFIDSQASLDAAIDYVDRLQDDPGRWEEQ